jgi:low affinity Fe/Cu permease
MLTGATGTAAFYFHKFRTLDMQNTILTHDLEACDVDYAGLDEQLMTQNQRIADMNSKRLDEIAASNMAIRHMNDVVSAHREENQKLRDVLDTVRKDTREAMNNDEDFADWADDLMPADGWRLLRNAAEGGSTD